jgi:hypothetical protein
MTNQEWIAQALREEFSFSSDSEIRVAAELYEQIAREWSMPAEQLVTWIHLQGAETTPAALRAYCTACHFEERKRRKRASTEYPD